jgi:sortase A
LIRCANPLPLIRSLNFCANQFLCKSIVTAQNTLGNSDGSEFLKRSAFSGAISAADSARRIGCAIAFSYRVASDDKTAAGTDGAVEDSTPDRNHVRKRGRDVLKWVQRLLLLCGLVLVGVYGAARIESFIASRAALKKFATQETELDTNNKSGDETVSSGTEPSLSDSMNSTGVDFSRWDERRVRAYKQNIGKQSGVPLAVLRIPKIQLEVPLFEGTDDFTLNHAVGRIVGTARPGEPGNIGIAGHRDGFFRGLKDVSVGDAIELKTLQGTDTYIVDEIQIVKPENVEVLQSRPVSSLTLVTCYPFYFFGSAPQRYIVKASLLREKKREAESSTLSPPSAANNR